jgi:SAM-dependent methyltransferase
MIPECVTVLDVGTGDGWLPSRIGQRREDLCISGIDVLVREKTHIPVRQFDGTHIPFENNAFDVLLFIDVLHHVRTAEALLRDALRVAKLGVIIKDHCCANAWDRTILSLRDNLANRRHGINLEYNYYSKDAWNHLFCQLDAEIVTRSDKLGLYPWFAKPLFERKLHFIAEIKKCKQ